MGDGHVKRVPLRLENLEISPGKSHKILEKKCYLLVIVEWPCVLFAKFDQVFSVKKIICQSGKVGAKKLNMGGLRGGSRIP